MPFTTYQEAQLWKQAFVDSRADSGVGEQNFFQTQYQVLREKAAMLVASIEADVPGLTVHDISHLDALWDMASLLAGNKIDLNPAEAYVFGAAVLLHDAGMSLATYPNRVEDLKATTIWKDLIALPIEGADRHPLIERDLVSIVLRKLHAQKAGDLPAQPFFLNNREKIFLIDETELRKFYGRSIGLLAYSHWWPIDRVEREFVASLGAFPPYTRCPVDLLKLACLLRVSDAIHLDRRRAPLFKKGLISPTGASLDHWTFQEKLASPRVEGDPLSSSSVVKLLRGLNEITVCFGAIDHNEEDGIPKTLFEMAFKQSDEVLVVPQYDGRIRTARVRSLGSFEYRSPPYALQVWFQQMLDKLWGDFEEEELDDVAVGTVNGIEVVRNITRFTRR